MAVKRRNSEMGEPFATIYRKCKCATNDFIYWMGQIRFDKGVTFDMHMTYYST